MARESALYVCQSCGYEAARWLGCCPDCGEWNTFEERRSTPAPAPSKTAEKAAKYQTTRKSEIVALSEVEDRQEPRSSTGNEELDAKFVKEAAAAGFVNLKGHRTVGGMRASIYNAMPEEGVKALVEFMKDFEAKNA